MYLKNRSKKYIRQKKELDRYLDEKLNDELKDRRLEFQYECIIKMGEANELQQYLGGAIRYNGYKNPEGVLKCHAFKGDQFVKEMRLEDFIKEYNTLLMKYNIERNKDYWTRLNSAGAAANFYTKDKFSQPEDVKDFNMPAKEKKKRQTVLRSILLGTINQIDKLE